jgi:dihydrofolate synthase/folylpolyglutamate synthase
MPHWPIPLWHQHINYDLAKMQTLLEKLGDAHLKIPPVIHVAGTNGKGSTLAFMRSILEAQGLRVHCYTSPHLVRFNERIVVAGKEISDALAYELLEQVRLTTLKHHIEVTFFEGVTAAAFLAFAQIPADVSLIEVGMGGRLDATNLVMPHLSVITPISFDHTKYLGDKIWQIAGEKAGIMKKNTPCIVSLQNQEAFNVLEHKAQELDIPLIAYEYDFIVKKTPSGFIYQDQTQQLDLSAPSLLGDHQYINAATAIAGVLNLRNHNISQNAIKKGIASAKWPARLQQISSGSLFKLLPKNVEMFLDGAHNQAGAHVLSMYLTGSQAAIIVGLSRGKNIREFLEPFVGKVIMLVAMLVESEPSSYKALEIKEVASELGFLTQEAESFAQAIEYIGGVADLAKKTKIVVCGSLYLASDALKS